MTSTPAMSMSFSARKGHYHTEVGFGLVDAMVRLGWTEEPTPVDGWHVFVLSSGTIVAIWEISW